MKLLISASLGLMLLCGCATSGTAIPEGAASLFLDAPYRYEVNGFPHAVVVLPVGEYVPIADAGETRFYKAPKLITINGKVQVEHMGIFLSQPNGKHKGWGVYWHYSGSGFTVGSSYEFVRPPFRHSGT
jgi:hypothetical protein